MHCVTYYFIPLYIFNDRDVPVFHVTARTFDDDYASDVIFREQSGGRHYLQVAQGQVDEGQEQRI